jgi:O-antigen ligase
MAGMGVGLGAGFLVGTKPLYVGLALVAIAVVLYFFASFEQAVLGLLVLRSSIDSMLPLPSVFGVGLNVLVLLYVTVILLTGRTVHTDGFWWFFAGWWVLQGLWVILLPMGALGLDASFLPDSIREWVRLFSWLMVYLLIMQLKDRLPPEKIIHTLFLSLVIPIIVALIQVVVPSVLPSNLSPLGGDTAGLIASEGARIRGTIGHPNGFATYLFLFIGLTLWKLSYSKQRWFWLLLLGLLAFFYVGTKALFSLMMLAVFVLVLIAPRLNVVNLIGGILLFAIVIGLFASTEFGQQRLGSIANTPLLNRDIDTSRAILLAQGDYNSFNWRISQWYLLLKAWREYPILGYGLGLSTQTAGNGFLPHNDYIRFLTEGGIVGLGTFLVFFGAQGLRLFQLIRHAQPGSRRHELCLILLAVFIAIPVGMITENIWGHTLLFLYWYTLLAVAGWDWNELSSLKNTASVEPPARLPS